MVGEEDDDGVGEVKSVHTYYIWCWRGDVESCYPVSGRFIWTLFCEFLRPADLRREDFLFSSSSVIVVMVVVVVMVRLSVSSSSLLIFLEMPHACSFLEEMNQLPDTDDDDDR
jgi:hypothetical protein